VGSHGDRDDVATKFVAVRFGNVLNSAGSVIPLFRRQIERGGPVTVTDPEMTRFFMTIPEAVALVIQAGAIGGRGRILVLDMGEPIRIVDLARNMIRLSGKEPDRDVQIAFIGARPGEKIHEELFNSDEQARPTAAERIVRAVRSSSLDPAWVDRSIKRLEALVAAGDEAGLADRVVEVVTERIADAPASPASQPTRDTDVRA
jgi:FlaA1/EpsC-like NDP-sugar epimerase